MSESRAPATAALSGLLLVDKPAGISSHDVVSVVRRAARTRRVGHAGTLDPFATGLLVLAVGPSTRLLPYLDAEPKVYDARIVFGVATDTDDATGAAVASAALPDATCFEDRASPQRLAAEASLTGPIAQVPPAYSAKHVDGQRAYALARRGTDVALPPVMVTVHGWQWRGGGANHLDTRITCSGGTYVRALARDLGRALGSVAHCGALRRIASGRASVDGAVPLSALEPGSVASGEVALRPTLDLLGALAHEALLDEELESLRQGRRLRARVHGARAALVHNGAVVAIAERVADDWWQPRVVLLGASA
ncbi:MAG: tRNA pseudouridine(55) synthase TruB [Gemmatimonadetes bacterium]|nr:tRNA pseudouridine(55) synthase TruB [Gemmatimonadota bacterium]